MIPPVTEHMTGRRKVTSGTLRTVCPSSHGLSGTIEADSYRDSSKLEALLPPGIPSTGCSCSPPHLFTPVLRKGPAGEGSRPRKRYCPFRVRFADETLQDTALRYWERNRAVRQNIFPSEQTALPAVSVSERVLGSVGRWLDSLPRALYPRVQDTVAGSSFWTCPRVATIPRPRGGLRTFLDTPNNVDQESFLPSLVLQSVLKQGRPKGYQLLLPSTTNRQQAHR
ncbi:uncharacterized protein C9orf50 homolog isoform X10 [Mus musculus]|uniref:uncharacterized protein C9orf50 homolog isoform X10 n=1 Tax=Mus musculus TaxID=10090 RepID=UPI0011AE7BBD|nr:uncharacterized protein C9orf50 homolog isoform X10 [Mus musculus]